MRTKNEMDPDVRAPRSDGAHVVDERDMEAPTVGRKGSALRVEQRRLRCLLGRGGPGLVANLALCSGIDHVHPVGMGVPRL